MIGLGTYAFFWQHSDRATEPLTLAEMLQRTRELGVDLFQICDYAPMLGYSAAELRELRAMADGLGIRLELGTKGITVERLATFLQLATMLGATLVRSMTNGPGSRPTTAEAEGLLRTALPAYEDAGVTLALETYEQLSSATLVGLVETIASDALGICLDPANTVAGLENPREVVERCAPYTKNLHVKGFAFARQDGWVGFTLVGAPLGTGLLDYDHEVRTLDPDARGINRIVEHWLPWQGSYAETAAQENDWTLTTTTESIGTESLTIAVVGAGGKMGMRVSNNLVKTRHTVLYSESSSAGQERVTATGRTLTATEEAVSEADVVVLAVPDLALKTVSAAVVPLMTSGAILLTLDPAAVYAGLFTRRKDVIQAVTHPCHPSVFVERHTPEEYADTFGGIAALQDAIAAIESDDLEHKRIVETVVRVIFAPVGDVHWVTVKQLAQLEPTLVETIACMIGALLKEALDEAVNTMGVPEPAARAILLGHTQVALANTLKGDNPLSDACLIAMDYGRSNIIKEDWKKVFQDDELDKNLAVMLHLDHIER